MYERELTGKSNSDDDDHVCILHKDSTLNLLTNI